MRCTAWNPPPTANLRLVHSSPAQPGPPPQPLRPPMLTAVQPMRCSDAEREQITDRLLVHYMDGRLTADEHQERVEAVLAATYRFQLQGFLADLPHIPRNRLPKRTYGHFCHDRWGVLAALTVGFTGAWTVAVAADGAEWVLLMLALTLPVLIVYGLVLGLPCPRHHGKRRHG